MVLNSITPYVGLKTEFSFTMFSDLLTEGDEWNSIIIPPKVRIFGYQEDLVTIIDSSNPDLQVFAGDAYRLPFAEFHRIASMRPKSSVSYERGGKVYHLEQVADDQKLAKTPPLLA